MTTVLSIIGIIAIVCIVAVVAMNVAVRRGWNPFR